MVIENATNLHSSLRTLDFNDTGFVAMQDFRGALYLKLGLTAEQVCDSGPAALSLWSARVVSFLLFVQRWWSANMWHFGSMQVDAVVCGTHEGDINYPDWLAFFTTNPVCTTTDIGQFIRFGGASSTGARDAELKDDRYTVSGQGVEGVPMVIGAPGVDRETYPTAVQVSDIHAIESEDIRNNKFRREEEVLEELRKEALHRQHEEATLNSNWGTQHHLTK